jgi:hypothetical protein
MNPEIVQLFGDRLRQKMEFDPKRAVFDLDVTGLHDPLEVTINMYNDVTKVTATNENGIERDVTDVWQELLNNYLNH